MSGGSFNNLYCKVSEIAIEQRDDLDRMIAAFDKRGYLQAAKNARRIIFLLEEAQRIQFEASSLAQTQSDLWREIELSESGDSNEGHVTKVHDEYVKKLPRHQRSSWNKDLLLIREALGNMPENASHIVAGDMEWECKESPTKYCVYDDDCDSCHDECLFCGEPEERR